MRYKLIIILLSISFLLFTGTSYAGIDPKYYYVTGQAPPPQRRHRIAGGESFPPLPLPVVPMRRTEKKRPPTPPPLVVKLKYGIGRQWIGFGRNAHYLSLLADKALRMNYGAVEKDINKTEFDPSYYPILYMTGLVSFNLSNDTKSKLRKYLLSGGTLILDCNSGHYEIKKSFLKLLKEILPEYHLRPLPLDHPLYYSFYTIKNVTYQLSPSDPRIYNPAWRGNYPTPTIKQGPPMLYGVDIGSRTAVFLSTYDLGCGWVGRSFPYGNRYSVKDARKIGINMVAYILQFYFTGRYLSWEKIYTLPETSEKEFSIAQVIHSGYWDTSLNRLSRLLSYFRENTSSLPSVEPQIVSLSSKKIFNYPLLYFTGHDSFTLTTEEIDNLKEYTKRGGLIFVENRCGRSTFDKSFKKEFFTIFPEGKIKELPLSHPLYQIFYTIKKVRYSPWVKEFPSHEGKPILYSLKVKEKEIGIYSPYDLAWAWAEGVYAPYTRGVFGDSSYKLATNILVYLFTK